MKLGHRARRRLTVVETDEVGSTGEPEPSVGTERVVDETGVPAARRRARAAGQDAKALKAQAEHQVRRARRNLAVARELRQARVLVVDDSPVFLHAARSIVSAAVQLRLAGSAASGEEALRLLADLKPDLVLLDIHMPGMNGVETARIIRRRDPEIVVVLISAETAGLEGLASSAGATALVDKADLRPGTLDALWLEHRPGL